MATPAGILTPCRGIALKIHPKGHGILRIHYSADPEKDPRTEHGSKWLERLRGEFSSEALWRQEMEMDYGAKRGQLVFPEFRRDLHVVADSAMPEIMTRYCAIDPHPRTPHAVLWIGVDAWEDYYVYRELWRSKVYGEPHNLRDTDEDYRWTTKETAGAIAFLEGNRIRWMNPEQEDEFGIYEREPEGEEIIERFMDQAGKGFRARGGDGTPEQSFADLYHEYGISCRDPVKAIQTGEDAIHQALKVRKHEIYGDWPRLHISSKCPETILEMEKWRYKTRTRALDEKELWQEGIEARRHMIDLMRYLLTADLCWIPEMASRRYQHV